MLSFFVKNLLFKLRSNKLCIGARSGLDAAKTNKAYVKLIII